MGMTGWICQDEYLEKCAKLSDQEVGRLFRALMKYHATGTEPELAGRESIAFDWIKVDIDKAEKAYAEKCERNRQNRSSTIVNDRQRDATEKDDRPQNINNNINNINEDEEEDEDIISRARDAWRCYFGKNPTPALLNRLISTGMSVDLIIRAIMISAIKAPDRPSNYVMSVLADWQREKITTLDEATSYTMIRDGLAGKLPGIMNADAAQEELQAFRARK